MSYSPEKIPEPISDEGPVPEGLARPITEEDEERLKDMEEFMSKYPDGLQ